MRSDFRGALLSKIEMRSLPSRSLPALTRARNPRTERKGANATQSENQIRQLSDSGQKILLIDGIADSADYRENAQKQRDCSRAR